MELLEIISENWIELMSAVGVIITIICRSAKPMSPEKQAKWEEETKIKRLQQKRNRLAKLRQEDEEHKNKMLENLKEEIELEKELGENA